MRASKFLLSLLVATLCGLSNATDIITSYKDGTVRVGKQKKKLKIHRIGHTWQTATGVYLGGYVRESVKPDTYAIGYISHDLMEERFWPVKIPFRQFFTFKNDLYILDFAGNTFYKSNDEWKPGQWHFPPFWEVVYSDKFIIACHRRNIGMEAPPTRNGCVAPEKKWEIIIDWAYVEPKMCGNVLAIWEYTHAPYAWKLPNDVVQFDPETGKEIARKHGVKNVKDVCAVKFN